MELKMPRGAIPSPRSDLASADRYQPTPDAELRFPSGQFPSPNHELVAAQPYRASAGKTKSPLPASFLRWPGERFLSENAREGNSMWAEEAFAKACGEPEVFVPYDAVQSAEGQCGAFSFAQFMQTTGFRVNGKAYLDGPFKSIDWRDSALLNSAIAEVGPVKLGIPSAILMDAPAASSNGRITPGRSGWAIHGLGAGQAGDHCASLCGYGALAALVSLFEQHGVTVGLPPAMPAGLCYAMFVSGSIGVIDEQSLRNATGEAWVRNPTTIVRDLHG